MIHGPRPRLKKIGTMQTIDATTGAVLKTKPNAFTLLPAPPGTCQDCAVAHTHDQPHNRDSLFYQVRFASTHGRPPTWTDAMSHCTPEMQALVKQSLIETCQKHGLKVPADLMQQKPAGR